MASSFTWGFATLCRHNSLLPRISKPHDIAISLDLSTHPSVLHTPSQIVWHWEGGVHFIISWVISHPGTQQMIEWNLSEVESLVYSEDRKPLINKGIFPFLTSCFSAIWSPKLPHITRSGCLSENTSKSLFQIVLHCPGVCIFPWNSLTLAILPVPARRSDLL